MVDDLKSQDKSEPPVEGRLPDATKGKSEDILSVFDYQEETWEKLKLIFNLYWELPFCL